MRNNLSGSYTSRPLSENKQLTIKNNHKTYDSFSNGVCLICFTNMANAVIMECGHGGICTECVKDLCKKT